MEFLLALLNNSGQYCVYFVFKLKEESMTSIEAMPPPSIFKVMKFKAKLI